MTHKVAEDNVATAFVLIIGVVAFAVMFAVNSSVHSYLIVSYSNKVTVDENNGASCVPTSLPLPIDNSSRPWIVL